MKKIITALFLIAVCAGCYRTHNEGPAERAGRHVDNAVEETRDDIHRSARNAREMGHDVKERVWHDDDVRDRAERNNN